MKILLISYYHLQSDSTGSLRVRAMEKYFPQSGVDVAVLTCREQNEEITFCGNVVGVRDITRKTVPLPLFYISRIWQKSLRRLGMYRGYCASWRDTALRHADEIIERVKPDFILASYPCVEALEIGVALANKYHLPLISDFRDGLLFEPLDPEIGFFAVRRYYQSVESKIVAISKLIVTVSQPISDYFEKRYAHANVLTLPNGFDVDDVATDSGLALPSDVINVVHTGRVGLSRKVTSGKGRGIDAFSGGLHLLLERVPELSQKLRFHFVGELSGEERKCFLPLIKSGVVKLWGHQTRDLAKEFQRKADVLLLITAPDQASIATGKIFEYLSTDKPILALTRGTAAEKIVLETGAGIVVAPDSPDAIAAALENIVSLKGQIPMKRNADMVNTFSRERQVKLLASRMQ